MDVVLFADSLCSGRVEYRVLLGLDSRQGDEGTVDVQHRTRNGRLDRPVTLPVTIFYSELGNTHTIHYCSVSSSFNSTTLSGHWKGISV